MRMQKHEPRIVQDRDERLAFGRRVKPPDFALRGTLDETEITVADEDIVGPDRVGHGLLRRVSTQDVCGRHLTVIDRQALGAICFQIVSLNSAIYGA
jgi:hypothetical protein